MQYFFRIIFADTVTINDGDVFDHCHFHAAWFGQPNIIWMKGRAALLQCYYTLPQWAKPIPPGACAIVESYTITNVPPDELPAFVEAALQ